MKYSFSSIILIFFTIHSFAQWEEFRDIDQKVFTSVDSLFYGTGIEDSGGRKNAKILFEVLPKEYLLQKANSQHIASVRKAVSILSLSRDTTLIPQLAILLNQDEAFVSIVIHTMCQIDGRVASPILQEFLLGDADFLKEQKTLEDLIYAIKYHPNDNSAKTLKQFILKIENSPTQSQSILRLASKTQKLLEAYLASQTSRNNTLSNALNNEGLENFSWALFRISKDRLASDLNILKSSKKHSINEILILRKQLGDIDFTQSELKRLASLPNHLF